MADKKDLLIKAGLLTELGTPIPELLTAMEEYAKEYCIDFIERISRNPISCYSVNIKGQNKQFFLGQDYIKRLLDSLK